MKTRIQYLELLKGWVCDMLVIIASGRQRRKNCWDLLDSQPRIMSESQGETLFQSNKVELTLGVELRLLPTCIHTNVTYAYILTHEKHTD